MAHEDGNRFFQKFQGDVLLGFMVGKRGIYVWIYSEHVGIHEIYIAKILGEDVEKHGNYIDVDTHERVSSHNMNGT